MQQLQSKLFQTSVGLHHALLHGLGAFINTLTVLPLDTVYLPFPSTKLSNLRQNEFLNAWW